MRPGVQDKGSGFKPPTSLPQFYRTRETQVPLSFSPSHTRNLFSTHLNRHLREWRDMVWYNFPRISTPALTLIILWQSITAPSPTSGRAYSLNSSRHPIERRVLQHPREQYSEQSQVSEHSQSSQTTQSSQWSQASQNRKFRKIGTGGGAWNAPIAHFMMTETSGQTYGFGTKTEERYCRLAEEGKKWMLGPMPPPETFWTSS